MSEQLAEIVGRWTWHDLVSSERGPEKATTRHVLLALGRYMSTKTATAYPGVRRLAADTGMSRATVMKHIEIAEKEGWIRRAAMPRAGGKFQRFKYVASVPRSLHGDLQPAVDSSPSPGQPDATPGQPDEPTRSTSRVHQVKQVDLNQEENQEEEPPEGGTFHETSPTEGATPASMVSALADLEAHLDEWEAGFFLSCKSRVESGKALTASQYGQLPVVLARVRSRAKRGAAASLNVPTKDQQRQRDLAELENAERVYRERLEDGIPISEALTAKLALLRSRVSQGPDVIQQLVNGGEAC